MSAPCREDCVVSLIFVDGPELSLEKPYRWIEPLESRHYVKQKNVF